MKLKLPAGGESIQDDLDQRATTHRRWFRSQQRTAALAGGERNDLRSFRQTATPCVRPSDHGQQGHLPADSCGCQSESSV